MNDKNYFFPLNDYISEENFKKLKEFSKDKETPFIVIDLKKIEEKYDELKQNIPYAKIYYAVKANPHEEIIKLLYKKGAYFDIASVYELDWVFSLGVTCDRISFGNTIKKESAIKYAYGKGVRLFVTDSGNDLKKLAKNAPGANVFFRILCDGAGADWPLSRKFGAHPDKIFRLILESKNLGLNPYGLSFHVGSQQRDVGRWDDAIAQCRYLFEASAKKGIHLKMINMGGGFPAHYKSPTHEIPEYTKEITRFLEEDFPEGIPEIIIEPGRSIAGDCGVIVSEVVLISRISYLYPYRWVYLDIGKFGGLIETLDESIKYPIYVERTGPAKEVIIAGPTCDSMDILYEDYKYKLPESLTEGDKVYIFTAGAYTQSYCSVSFNGFPPIKSYILK